MNSSAGIAKYPDQFTELCAAKQSSDRDRSPVRRDTT
jgi:hypothetical protein